MNFKAFNHLLVLFLLMMVGLNVQGGVTLKIATMAPAGSSWGDALQAMARDIKKKTSSEVRLRVTLGGSAGDEPVVLRKVRMNQLHGGIFTGKALGDVNSEVRVMEVPFTFEHDRGQAWKTLEKARGFFDEGFSKKGHKNLGFFEIGPVYLVSTKDIKGFDSLKGTKIWSWSGDLISSSLIEALKLSGVALQLQDVLQSLETGVVEVAYSSPLGILAMQWQKKVKYLVDYPMAYSVGAFLVSKKAWSRVPAKWQSVVEQTVQEHVKRANEKTIQGNRDALESMKSSGIKFNTFQTADIQKITQARQQLVKKLMDEKLFSQKSFSILEEGRKAIGK